MDLGNNGGNGSADHRKENSNSNNPSKSYHRHTPEQIQQLESFFKDCPNPNWYRRLQLSRNLGLGPNQIKNWFQNKRTQNKAHNEQADKNSLRQENERINNENLAIKEALKNVICPACRDPPVTEEELRCNIEQLKIKNTILKQEYERVSLMLSNLSQNPITQAQSLSAPAGFLNQGTENGTTFPYQFKGIQQTEKILIVETTVSALNELIELLKVNEPLWVKSHSDDVYVLCRDIYNSLFPKLNNFTTSRTRIESSKDSCVVKISPQQLVQMFLDPSKWSDLFPTIVPRAKILEVIDAENLSGPLILMYGRMHVMSPLVAPREFYFLRYSQPLKPSGTWIVVDVSYDSLNEIQNRFSTRSWKFPSGCMIQSLPNGKTQVTWVEHVKVEEDMLQTHHLYRDLISCGHAYGAKRWTTTLERMCERLAYTMGSSANGHELGGVVDLQEGHKNILNLSQRMVKEFCETFSMSDKLDLQNLLTSNKSEIRVSVVSQPDATILSAATSIWLPLSRDTLFHFFKDEKTRPQWDVVWSGHLVNQIAHIPCGTRPGNCVFIIQPVSHEKNKLMLQENCTDSLGALVVYAPIELRAIAAIINGKDTERLDLLPSGFIISDDGRFSNKLKSIDETSTSTSSSSSSTHGGSILTLGLQIAGNAQSRQMNMEAITILNTLVNSTIQKIKASFNIKNLE